MSAEATGWVFRHSKMAGAALLVHLAVADSVNDQNENEFWMSVGRLAEKVNMERRTAGRQLQVLLDVGYLTLLEDNSKARKPSRYRFEAHGSTEPMTRVEGTQAHGSTRPTNPIRTQENPTRAIVGQGFNDFWAVYPRKKAKGAAQKAYESAVKRAASDQRLAIQTINKGAELYAKERRGKDETYTAYPATWLNGDCWYDEMPANKRETPEEARARKIAEYNAVQYT